MSGLRCCAAIIIVGGFVCGCGRRGDDAVCRGGGRSRVNRPGRRSRGEMDDFQGDGLGDDIII